MELTCGEALKSSEEAEFECEGVRGAIPMKWYGGWAPAPAKYVGFV